MASTKIFNNELTVTVLVLSALLSTASAVDCHGRSFQCVNSTHFMICVDLGGGVSRAIDDFYIACPPPTVCQGTNHFECEFPAPTTPATTLIKSKNTLTWEEIVTVSPLNNTTKEFSENYMDTTPGYRATTAVEYSVTTDTTVDIAARTVSAVNITNEVNATEIIPTSTIETTPIEIIPFLRKDRNVTEKTQTAENVTTTEKYTTNSNQYKILNGKESKTMAIKNTSATTENIVITENLTEESVLTTTEPTIQTTYDAPELDTAYLYTASPQVVTLFHSEDLTNSTLIKEPSVASTTTENIIITKTLTEESPLTTTEPTLKTTYDPLELETAYLYTASPQVVTLFHSEDLTNSTLIKEPSVASTTTANIVITKTLTEESPLTTTEPTLKTTYDPLELETAYLYTAPPQVVTLFHSEDLTDSTLIKEPSVASTTTANIVITKTLIEESVLTTTEPTLQTTYDPLELETAYLYTASPQVVTLFHSEDLTNSTLIKEPSVASTTNENIVITKTLPQESTLTTTEPTIQTTYDPLELDTAYLYTISPQVVKLFPSKDITNRTLAKEPSVAGENFQEIEKQTVDSLDSVLTNKDFISISQNVEITSTVESIVEITSTVESIIESTTVRVEQLIDIADDKIITYHDPNTPPLLDNTLKPYQTDLHKNPQGIIESNLTSSTLKQPPTNKKETKTPQIRKINDNVGEIKSSIRGSVVAPTSNKENPSITPDSDKAFSGLTVTTDYAIDTTEINVIDFQPMITFTNTQNNEGTTTQDGLLTTEISENGLSIDQQTTINEESLTQYVTQNGETVNLDNVTTEAGYTISNSNVHLVTTQAPLLMTNAHNSEDTELGGSLIIENAEISASTELPITKNEKSLPIDTTNKTYLKENFVPNSDSVNQDIVPTYATYNSTTIMNTQSRITEAPSIVTNAQTFQEPLLEEFSANTEQVTTIMRDIGEAATTDISAIVNNKPMMTEAPSLETEIPKFHETGISGPSFNENDESITTTELPTTINEKRLTINNTNKIIPEENNIIPISDSVNQGIVSPEITKPITIGPSSLVTNTQENSTVLPEFAANTDQVTSVTRQSESTDTFLIIDNKPMMPAAPSLATTTPKLVDTGLSEAFINENEEYSANMEEVYTVISNTQLITTEAPLLMTKVQNTERNVTMVNDVITEQPPTINKENWTTNSQQNIASENIFDSATHAVNIEVIATETVYTPMTISKNLIPEASEVISNKSSLLTTQRPASGTDGAFKTEVVGQTPSIKQQYSINEESVSAEISQNVASIIIPKTAILKKNITATKDVNVISNAQPAPKDNKNTKGSLSPLENILSVTKIGSTNPVIAKAAELSFEKKIQLSDNKVIPSAGHAAVAKLKSDEYDSAPANAIELNVNMEPTLGTTDGDLVINYRDSNITVLTAQSVQSVKISDKTMTNKATLNENHVEGNVKKESNDIADQNYISQRSEREKILVTTNTNYSKVRPSIVERNNDNAGSININQKESNLGGNLNQNSDYARTSNEFISQQPNISSLNPGEISKIEQIGTVTQNYINMSTNGFLGNVTIVTSEPEINTFVEDSTNPETNTVVSGRLDLVSSSTVMPTRATALETITGYFRPQPKSTVDQTQNNLGGFRNNVNLTSNKIEFENIKNSSNDRISPSQSVIYQYKLPVKEVINSEKVDASSKSTVLDVVPLPKNNVGIHPSGANTPVVSELTSVIQNVNIAQIKELHHSATINPGIQASINGVDITTAPTLGNPTLNTQTGDTNKANIYPQNSPLSTSKGNFQSEVQSKNNDIAKVSTFGDAHLNLPAGIVTRAEFSTSEHPQLKVQIPIVKTSNSDSRSIILHTESRENNTSQNILGSTFSDNIGIRSESVPEINNEIYKFNKKVPVDSAVSTVYQKINSTLRNTSETELKQSNVPTNYTLSTQTQNIYPSSTIRVSPQSVTSDSNLHATHNEPAIPFTCVNGIKGRFSDKDDCRKFYICVGNYHPIVGNCPENTVFSDIKKLCTKNLSHCIRENEFKCPSAGRFSDFLKDNAYYICVNHRNHLYRFKFQCQKGYILNKTIVKCVETNEIESNESVSISSIDNSNQVGSTSSSSGSTDKNGMNTNTMINTDDSSNKSDYSSKTEKSKETEKTDELEGNRRKIQEGDDEDEVFKCKKEGKFPIRNECRRYYLCKKRGSQYRRKVKKCDSDSLFHKDKKKCVDAESYECE